MAGGLVEVVGGVGAAGKGGVNREGNAISRMANTYNIELV